MAALASTARTIIIFVTNITTRVLPLINLGTSLSLAGARAIHSSLHALLLGFNHDKLGNNFCHLWRQQRAPQFPRQCDAAYISAAVSKSLLDQHARAGHHISIMVISSGRAWLAPWDSPAALSHVIPRSTATSGINSCHTTPPPVTRVSQSPVQSCCTYKRKSFIMHA